MKDEEKLERRILDLNETVFELRELIEQKNKEIDLLTRICESKDQTIESHEQVVKNSLDMLQFKAFDIMDGERVEWVYGKYIEYKEITNLIDMLDRGLI
jgi:hypothetical protein